MKRRYYFHLRTGNEDVPDDVGTEFEDSTRARIEALDTLCQLARDTLRETGSLGELSLRIANAEQRELALVSLRIVEAPAGWAGSPQRGERK